MDKNGVDTDTLNLARNVRDLISDPMFLQGRNNSWLYDIMERAIDRLVTAQGKGDYSPDSHLKNNIALELAEEGLDAIAITGLILDRMPKDLDKLDVYIFAMMCERVIHHATEIVFLADNIGDMLGELESAYKESETS